MPINLGEAEANAQGRFEPLEPGVYEGHLADAAFKVSANDNPMISCEIKLDNNRRVWHNYMLTDGFVYIFKRDYAKVWSSR